MGTSGREIESDGERDNYLITTNDHCLCVCKQLPPAVRERASVRHEADEEIKFIDTKVVRSFVLDIIGVLIAHTEIESCSRQTICYPNQ